MNTGGKAGTHIADTVTNNYGVVHIQVQFITRSQQHTGARFATGAILIFPMRAKVYSLYLTSHLVYRSYHFAMNFIHRFDRNTSTGYSGLICTHNDAVARLCELRNCFARSWQKAEFTPAFDIIGSVFIDNPVPVYKNGRHAAPPSSY